MISSRYAMLVIILLIIALIPTVIHSYIGATAIDGKSVQSIPSIFNNFTSTPSKRNAQWGKDIFDSEDWFERDYFDTQRTKIRLFVARSYDHKRLYHHPELALSYGQNLTKKSIVNITEHPEIFVHLLSNDNSSNLIAYVLLHDKQFIENPVIHQLSDSTRLLINARKPMTLFYASIQSSNGQFKHSAIEQLLLLAIESFSSQQINNDLSLSTSLK